VARRVCDISQGITSRLPVGLRKHTQNINPDDVTSATRTGNLQNNAQSPLPPAFEAISTTKYPLKTQVFLIQVSRFLHISVIHHGNTAAGKTGP